MRLSLGAWDWVLLVWGVRVVCRSLFLTCFEKAW